MGDLFPAFRGTKQGRKAFRTSCFLSHFNYVTLCQSDTLWGDIFCSTSSYLSSHFRIVYLFIYLFTYLWLHWVSVAARGLSLVAASRGLLFVAVCGLLIAVASLVAEHGL